MALRRWQKVVAGLAVVLLSLGAGYGWLLYELFRDPVREARCKGRERFEATAWRDTLRAFTAAAPRGCMIDDLLASGRLRGRSRGEVIALLGEDAPTGYFSDYDLVYWLGPERGPFGIDSEWLVVRLDRAERVMEARLVTD